MPLRWLHVLLVIWASLRVVCPAVIAQDAEDATIAVMVRTGLTDSAIAYVQSRRDLSAAKPDEYAKWTMRLMETFAQAALHDQSDANQHWADCEQTLEIFTSSFAQDRRLPWLRWQSARCRFLRAQDALASWLAAPSNENARNDSLQAVREALAILAALEDDILQRLPIAARQGIEGGSESPAEQLHQLSVDTDLLRCESLMVRSQLYEPGSKDRIAAATQVENSSTQVLARTNQDWPSRDQLRIAQASAKLELNQQSQALTELFAIARGGSSESTRIRAAAIAIEFLTSKADLSNANALMPLLQNAGPEYEIALIRLAIAELKNVSPEHREKALEAIVDRVKAVENRFGSYWKNRADALLVGGAASSSLNNGSSTSIELVLTEVKQLLAASKVLEAIEKLVKHRDIEAKAGRGATAIKWGSFAAALHQREKQWADAAHALDSVTVQFADAEGAAEMHLLVTTLYQQALVDEPDNPALRERYERALRDQLLLWPDAAASEQPTQWAILWLENLQRHQELLELLLDRCKRANSVDIQRNCLQWWLEQLLVCQQQDTRESSSAALRTAIASSGENSLTTESTVRNVALLVAICAETMTTWPAAQRQRELINELDRLTVDSTRWQIIKYMLRVLMLARDEQLSSARRLERPSEISELSAKLKIGMSGSIVQALGFCKSEERSAWLGLLGIDAHWAQLLVEDKLPISQAYGHRLQLWLAEVGSLESLQELALRSPRDGEVKLQLANALSEIKPPQLKESSKLAMQITAGSKRGSEVYLAARWRSLQNQLLQNENEAARSAAKLILASQPINDSVWRARFEAIAGNEN
ncbi:MAG: hypothetical protein KDB22_24275 [Planctomycetales bacterium]|nr:hypothetical protein [Planctomycetales bacterium]